MMKSPQAESNYEGSGEPSLALRLSRLSKAIDEIRASLPPLLRVDGSVSPELDSDQCALVLDDAALSLDEVVRALEIHVARMVGLR